MKERPVPTYSDSTHSYDISLQTTDFWGDEEVRPFAQRVLDGQINVSAFDIFYCVMMSVVAPVSCAFAATAVSWYYSPGLAFAAVASIICGVRFAARVGLRNQLRAILVNIGSLSEVDRT